MQTPPDALPPTSAVSLSGARRTGDPGPTGESRPADAPGRVDVEGVRRAVRRALAHGSALPRHEELVELEALLREHIRRLLPIARAHAATLRPVTPRRLRYQARLEWIANQAERGLGEGLPSARRQVRSLAQDCRWLLHQTSEWNRKATP